MPNEIALVESRNMPRLASSLYDSIRSGLRASVTEENLTARALKLTTEAVVRRTREAADEALSHAYYQAEDDKMMERLGLLEAACNDALEFIAYRQHLVALANAPEPDASSLDSADVEIAPLDSED